MRSWNISILIFVLGVCFADVAGARTWYVELDGSGDFDDIQPAVDASASGDTIKIGPGRFDTFHDCVAPGWTEDAIVSVTKDNLTFIGSGKGVTILGTSTYYSTHYGDPKVFCSVEPFDCTIKYLTIENVEQGIYWWKGSINVEGCMIRAFHDDFIGIGGSVDGGSAKDCEFEMSGVGSGAIFLSSSRGFEFQDCVFRGHGFGVRVVNGSSGFILSGCSFEDSYVAIKFDGSASGSISNCHLTNNAYWAIQVSDDSHVVLDRVFIDGAESGIVVGGSATALVTNVVVENTTYAGLLVLLKGIVTLNNSHILPAYGLGVRCTAYSGTHIVLDMTGNYWGTVDPDTIAAMINDVNDDPNVHYTIEYLPIADGPVPTESTSWGSVKSMFR